MRFFEYAGHAYAKLNEEEGYRVIGEIEEKPLSKIRWSSWWLHPFPFNIYGYKEDAEHLFWYGDFADWLTFGNVYYREDIVIPKFKSENVKSIDVFEDLEPYAVRDDLKNYLPVLSISERDEVNKILDSFSKAKDKEAFINEFFETYLKSEVKDNQEKDYMVYATFYDYQILRYCIGGCIA